MCEYPPAIVLMLGDVQLRYYKIEDEKNDVQGGGLRKDRTKYRASSLTLAII